MKLPFIGPTALDRYDDNSSQLSQNLYVHSNSGKQSLYPTPGETLFADIGTGEIRGEINFNGTYFIVSGGEFYEVDAAGNGVSRGTLNTNTGQCRLAHNGANNGKQICIVDGTNGYIYNSLYQTFAQIKQYSSSTTDGTTANKLVDSGALFTTDGTKAGTVVYNTTDGTKATITAIDDAQTLSVSADIFVSGETYEVGTDAFPDTATHVQFMDGFFLWNNPASSGQFVKSASYDGTDIDALDFATAERSPDELQGILRSDRQLWLVGKDTAEVWFNSGALDFPFEPVPSGFSEWGTPAPYSMTQTSGLSFWLSQNEAGQGLVVMANGLQISIISTPEIAAQIASFTDLTTCYSFTYQKYQHTFVAFTFQTDETTLVYDTTEKAWHTWHSNDLGYHRSTGHTFIYDKHLVGDPITGRIYELDWDVNTDNGEIITRRRVTPTFHAEDKDIRWDVIEIDIKEGVGDATTPDPQMMLRWRDDNGSWSNWHSRSMGKVGERNKKLRWRRLGRSSERVFEIQVTDPVPVVIFEAFARIKADSEEMR
jgi:hypothetical protein